MRAFCLWTALRNIFTLLPVFRLNIKTEQKRGIRVPLTFHEAMHNQVILAAIGSFAAATIAVLLVSELLLPDNAIQNANERSISVATVPQQSRQAFDAASVKQRLQPRKQTQPTNWKDNKNEKKKTGEIINEDRIGQADSTHLNSQNAATRTGANQKKPDQAFGNHKVPVGTSAEATLLIQKGEGGATFPPHEIEVPSLLEDAGADAPKTRMDGGSDTETFAPEKIAVGTGENRYFPKSESAFDFGSSPQLSWEEPSENPGFDTSSFRISSSPTQAQLVQSGGPAASESSDGEKAEEAETLGVPPPEEKPAFLRERSILLPPGQYQFEYGVRYGVDASTFPVAGVLQTDSNQVQIANANQKRRLLTTPLELRFGVSEDLQAFLSMPLGWSSQSLSVGNIQQDNDNLGIGDLGLGLTRVLWAPKKTKLRLLGFIQASAPTGDSTVALTQQAREASLGAGYWTLTSGLNVTETYDPLVLFSSVGFTYTFGTTLDSGAKLNAGNTLFYQTGVGYSINSNITVSASFSGASTGKAELNGVVSGGTRTEPFTLRLAGTISEPKKKGKSKFSRTREPFLRFGLTSLANDVEFGMRWTY